nr:hypothetical protein CFP56_33756 [Quercus suber]
MFIAVTLCWGQPLLRGSHDRLLSGRLLPGTIDGEEKKPRLDTDTTLPINRMPGSGSVIMALVFGLFDKYNKNISCVEEEGSSSVVHLVTAGPGKSFTSHARQAELPPD